MKKYVSCFLFFFFLTSASLITLFLMTAGEEARGTEEVQMQQSVEEPVFAKETEEIHVVLNQEQVEHETMAEDEERYFLVAEEGYLIVYDKGKESHGSLYPHAACRISRGRTGTADDRDLVSDNGRNIQLSGILQQLILEILRSGRYTNINCNRSAG